MTILSNAIMCAEFARQIWERGTIHSFECSYVFYLNSKGICLYHKMIAKGAYKRTNFNLRSTIDTAFHINSDDIIIVHNHTSHEADPSPIDIEMANYISSSLNPFDIQVADFIIITEFNHYSLKEHNQLNAGAIVLKK